MKFYLKHVPPNPTIEYANEILATVPRDCEEIVSQGGGSTIDVGKWISKELGLKHTAIPTTGGTGSEVTKYCVLMVGGKKKTFTDEKFIPTSYILNPQLLVTLPFEQTLSSGLDALAQSLESYWSINKTPESKLYSLVAYNLVLDNLGISLREPDNLQARMNMLLAANFSGKAINITKTNICHAISYPLTELYGIPHGIACGLTLAYFAKKIGVAPEVHDFLLELNLPVYKIDKEKVAKIVIEDPKLKDYPLIISYGDLFPCYL